MASATGANLSRISLGVAWYVTPSVTANTSSFWALAGTANTIHKPKPSQRIKCIPRILIIGPHCATLLPHMVRLLLLVAVVVVVALLVRRLVTAMRKPAAPNATPRASGKHRSKTRTLRRNAARSCPRANTVPVDNGFRCGAGCLPR